MHTDSEQGTYSPFDNIPDELKARPQWLVWKLVDAGEPKPRKVPYDAKTGKTASVSDPTTWAPYHTAAEAYEHGFAGVGFVFTMEDSFVGVDLDHCRNPETAQLEPWAGEIVERLDSYTEASPSGTGLHIICRGTLPAGRCKEGTIEMYSHRRFFCVTGEHIGGTLSTVEERTDALTALHAEVFGRREDKRNGTPTVTRTQPATGADLARVQEALRYIPAADYGVWLPVGMALHATGRDEAYTIWCDWSRTSSEKFDLAVCHKKWASFSAERATGVTIATIFQLAKEHGWKPSRNGQSAPHNAEPPPEPERAEARTDQQIHAPVFTCTDTGNAERLVHRFGQDLRYCHPWQKWVVWNGQRWTLDVDGDVFRKAKKTARGIATEETKQTTEDKQFKELLAWSKQSLNSTRLHAMVTLAQSELGVPVLSEHLDTNPWLLNCQNGTVDLKAGTLVTPNRGHLITKLVPLSYNPAASCPMWEAFLERIFAGKQDLIDYIQKAIGYTLTGLTYEQCFFLCHGMGSNGKSTFLDTLRAFFADYAEQAEFSTFIRKDRDVIRNDLAKLRSTRLVTAIESEEGKRLGEALIKSLTGGDALTARFLFSEYFTFIPTFKIWLATNHRPEIRDTTYAMWRRVRLISFNVVIPKAEQDKALPDKLKTELSGILSWAVRGCLAWQREGLDSPESVEAATKAYQSEQDILGVFLEECCILQADLTAPAGALYAIYKSWCEENNEKCLTQTALAERLKEKGLGNDRNSITGRKQWQGVGLKIKTVEES